MWSELSQFLIGSRRPHLTYPELVEGGGRLREYSGFVNDYEFRNELKKVKLLKEDSPPRPLLNPTKTYDVSP